MNIEPRSPSTLSDAELLVELTRLAAAERAATVRLIIALAEVDARRLYLGEGCSSLFVYCTRVLRLSEHAAYGRIEAVRASQRFPVLLEMLVRGDLTMTTVCLLGPHLEPENCDEVLARARYKSKREMEEIVAALRPQPDVPPTLRKLPEHHPKPAPSTFSSVAVTSMAVQTIATNEPKPAAPAIVQPLAPERYKLQITIGRETRVKLRRAQDLLRHAIPSGDLGVILDRALDVLLADVERKKFAASGRPRSPQEVHGPSRHIPSRVRRLVWTRDEGRCAFKGNGGRCGETGFLEFHHVRPFADGGEATSDNIELRCRAHNQYEADLFFGAPEVREEHEVFGGGVGYFESSPIIDRMRSVTIFKSASISASGRGGLKT